MTLVHANGEFTNYRLLRAQPDRLEETVAVRADLVPCPTGDGLYVERRPADPAPAFPNADPPTFEGV